MDPITRAIASAAAGVAASDATYVDDVFSTYVYEGNGSTQSIDNGIDLSGEGGLVWFKGRDLTISHRLYDTERGATKRLSSSLTDAESTGSNDLTAFNSDGFSIGNNSGVNASNYDYVSWSFRKAPGFFDVVTYTGNGTAGHTISHNLGSAPGMIIVKCTSNSTDWTVFHRKNGHPAFSNGGSAYASFLNTTAAADPSSAYWDSTVPTSTVFTVGVGDKVNGNGKTYVAYLFAHDDQSFGTNSDEAIIKCGSYSGTGSAYNEIDVGFEPQFVLFKNATTADNWYLMDTMRGLTGDGFDDQYLFANTSDAEGGTSFMYPTATGFGFTATGSGANQSGDTYIYMAIRHPNKPPESATEVFALDAAAASGTTANAFDAPFPVDMIFMQRWGSGEQKYVGARLMAKKNLYANTTGSPINSSFALYDRMDGVWRAFNDTNYSAQMFKRAPGFFDVVAYRGSNSSGSTAYDHNLGVVPELMVIRVNNSGGLWYVYSSATGNSKFLRLNGDNAESSLTWTAPTATEFTAFAGVNATHENYIVFLFATLDGISKVGSYSGTGSNVNVDCGFTAGARLVIIKRTDSTGDWYMWDTAHGIVSGNDPYILLNDANQQVTGTDYIDPLNAGFTVTSSAPAALNASGGTYLFLAIA